MITARSSAGTTLVETLIALFLLAIALVSLTTLFIQGAASVGNAARSSSATACAVTVMENLDAVPYDLLAPSFGAAPGDAGIVADTLSNTYAQRWQASLASQLPGGHATIGLTPLEPPAGAVSTFANSVAIRVQVTVLWTEGSHQRRLELATVRF